jgi:hypothetical protein
MMAKIGSHWDFRRASLAGFSMCLLTQQDKAFEVAMTPYSGGSVKKGLINID